MKDHVVLVTGGASGIGAAITRVCLGEGARVVVLSRVSARVAEFVAETSGPGFEFVEMKLDDPERCRVAVEHIRKRYRRLDGLVNNAGANDAVGLERGDPLRFEESLRHNLLHAYSLTHYALPMLKAAQGAIVNIASKVAMTGQGNTSGYAAAKGALLALTREWAAELLPYGVRVNAVVPAEVMTPLYEQWLAGLDDPAEKLNEITAQVPLGGRMTKPEEIAATVAFLLSPIQSGHTTGQQLLVDGGYVHLDRMLTAKPLH